MSIQNVAAQTITIAKYGNGQTKTRHLFQKNQLICIENLLENGKFYNRIWADSSYEYDSNQNIINKSYRNYHPVTWATTIFGNEHPYPSQFTNREAKIYYPNGQLRQHYLWHNDSLLTYHTYFHNNKHYENIKYKKISQHIFKQIVYRDNYRQEYTIDTLARTKQYVVYLNERLMLETIHYTAKNDYPKLIKQTFWDSAGQVISIVPDSLKLKPDKDHHLCLYGFRNHKDEWAIPPRFQGIQYLQQSYRVHEQEKYGILDDYGNEIIAPKWDYLYPLMDITYSSENTYPLSMYHTDSSSKSNPLSSLKSDFVFGNIADKYLNQKLGVMDKTGKVLLKPIYDDILYRKNNLYKIKIKDFNGFVDSSGNHLVPLQEDNLSFTNHPKVFIREHVVLENDSLIHTVGLMDVQGKTLLPAIYTDLKQEPIDNQCFWAYRREQLLGLYHVEKGWLLDSTFHAELDKDRKWIFHQLDAKGKKHYGLYDLKTNTWLLSIENKYEKIEYLNKHSEFSPALSDLTPDDAFKIQDYLQVSRKGKMGLFDVQAQKWLLPMRYDTIHFFGDSLYAVSEAGKWFFVNVQAQKISTQSYDYIGEEMIHTKFADSRPKDWTEKNPLFYDSLAYEKGCFAVQRDSVLFLKASFFPNNVLKKDIYTFGDTGNLLSELEGGWWIDRQNRLITSPTDTLLWTNGSQWREETHRVIRRKGSKNQLLIDLKTGHIKPFLNHYKFMTLNAENNWVLVRDSFTQRLGMTTMDEKVIFPPDFFGITERDDQKVFFARRDYEWSNGLTQLQVNDTLLGALDHNWQLYDSTGRLLTTDFFDYPIAWSPNGVGVGRTYSKYGLWNWKNRDMSGVGSWSEEGVGIGSHQQKHGLWNAQGKMLLPPKYDRIWYDWESDIFYIFHNKGNGIVRFGFANGAGALIMEPKLKHLSRFSGNYALVETEKGFGMVDKKGQYRITPALDGLETAPFSIQDAKSKWRTLYSYHNPQIKAHLDTFSVDSHRRRFENKVLQETVSNYFLPSQKINYQRNTQWYLCLPDTSISASWYSNAPTTTISDMLGSDKTISFTLKTVSADSNLFFDYTFHNFQWANNHWQKVVLTDFLTLNRDNELGLNQLLVAKVANLKYENMDCGNPATYWQRVRGRFYLRPEGLLVFMSRGEFEDRHESNISILLTWAELKPFLKL